MPKTESGASARPKTGASKKARPLRKCWLCGRSHRKYMSEHHVMTVEEDKELTVWLCRGCHFLVNLLSRYMVILRDEERTHNLIRLALFQARVR